MKEQQMISKEDILTEYRKEFERRYEGLFLFAANPSIYKSEENFYNNLITETNKMRDMLLGQIWLMKTVGTDFDYRAESKKVIETFHPYSLFGIMRSEGKVYGCIKNDDDFMASLAREKGRFVEHGLSILDKKTYEEQKAKIPKFNVFSKMSTRKEQKRERKIEKGRSR